MKKIERALTIVIQTTSFDSEITTSLLFVCVCVCVQCLFINGLLVIVDCSMYF